MKKIKTPTILQMEATECGAAALAIVLGYYGRYIPLEELRIDCGVSRDGCSAIMMLKAARKHGLVAQAAKIDKIAELKEIQFPIILFWEFNHFVVLEHIEDDLFYINDPDRGPRVVDIEQFNKAFTGVILLLHPDQHFEKRGNPPSFVKAMQRRITGAEHDILFVLLASFSLVVPTLLFVTLSKVFIDQLLIEKITSWQIAFFTTFTISIIIFALLSWFESYYMLKLKIKLLMVNSMTFLWRLLCLPLSFFDQRYAGDISERINANDRIANLLSNELTTALVGFLTMGIYFIIMFFINVEMTLIAAAFLAGNYYVYYKISRRYADVSRNFLQHGGKLLGIESYGIYLIDDLKANGREDDFFQRWSGIHAELITLQQQLAIYTQILNVIPAFTLLLATTIILGFGSLMIMHGVMTIGSLVAFQILYSNFSKPMQTLLQFGGDIQQIKGDITRLDDINNAAIDPRLTITENAKQKDSLASSIQLENVDFSYSSTQQMLKQISLKIEPGEIVAITGKSGQGKSTIGKLIAGLYQPNQGNIKIGETPLNNISASQLAKMLSFVDQDFFLYSGTLRENVSFWDDRIKTEDMIAALNDACIYATVLNRGGLNALVTENGRNFSGGQRQRIEVARALAKNPKMIILDEATSNLDPKTEMQILSNIKKRKITVIMITHRAEVLTLCDHVYLLKDGALSKVGRNSE